MGKKSKRNNRKERPAHKAAETRAGVTICVSPRVGENGILLHREMGMIKSSLLYADHVNLISPGLNMLWTLAPLRSVTEKNILGMLARLPADIIRMLGVAEGAETGFRDKSRALSKLPSNHPHRLEAERRFAPAVPLVLETVNDNFGDHAPEIDAVMSSKDITVVDGGFDFNKGAEAVTAWYRDKLTQAFADPSSTVVLDPETSREARGSLRAAHLSPYAASQSKRAATGTGLIERLPTFPDAPMEHVFEAREELADGRRSYREAVKRFAEGLESAALDESLPREIDDMWHDEVQPKLADLQNSVRWTRVGRDAAKQLVLEKANGNSMAIVVAGIGNLASLIPNPESAMIAGAGMSHAFTRQAFNAHAARKKHDLVYLLETDRSLGRRQKTSSRSSGA